MAHLLTNDCQWRLTVVVSSTWETANGKTKTKKRQKVE